MHCFPTLTCYLSALLGLAFSFAIVEPDIDTELIQTGVQTGNLSRIPFEHALLPRTTLPRDVWIVMDMSFDDEDSARLPNDKSGRVYRYVHSAVLFSGNDEDSTLHAQIVDDDPEGYTKTLRISDLTTDPAARKPRQVKNDQYRRRFAVHLGQATIPNIQLLNPSTGSGLLWSTWAYHGQSSRDRPDLYWRSGAHDCNSFARDLIAKLNFKLPSSSQVSRILNQARIYYEIRNQEHGREEVSYCATTSLYQHRNFGSRDRPPICTVWSFPQSGSPPVKHSHILT